MTQCDHSLNCAVLRPIHIKTLGTRHSFNSPPNSPWNLDNKLPIATSHIATSHHAAFIFWLVAMGNRPSFSVAFGASVTSFLIFDVKKQSPQPHYKSAGSVRRHRGSIMGCGCQLPQGILWHYVSRGQNPRCGYEEGSLRLQSTRSCCVAHVKCLLSRTAWRLRCTVHSVLAVCESYISHQLHCTCFT